MIRPMKIYPFFLLLFSDICQSRNCDIGTFACNSTDVCIPQHKNCDGVDDCEDASDENSCDDTWEDRYWDHLYRKRPNADLEENSPPNCSLPGYKHNVCLCRGSAVHCDHKGLTSFPTFVSSVGNIHILDLSGNHFPRVHKTDFLGFKELNSLILSHADLEKIDEGAFASVPSLTSLFLSNNRLQILPQDWFSENNNVSVLRIGYNELTTLPLGTFSNLHFLVELDIRRNRLVTIQDDALAPLTQLQVLFLNDNELKILNATTFPLLSNLRSLSLAENLIREIDPGTFAKLPNLRELFLTGNKLTSLHSGVFRNLHSLHVLNLNRNTIFVIDMDVFEPTTALLSLNLRNNKLKKLDKNIFLPAISLDYVYFDDFSLCSAALRVRVCEPKGDGISSLHNLLDNTLLRARSSNGASEKLISHCVWVMCALACGGNILVLLGRFLVKEPNAVHSLYIKNLSLSDLLMGIYLLLIAAADFQYRGNYVAHEEEWRNSTVCLICGFINTLSSESSVLILSLITWDRLISITKPLLHRQPKLREATLHLLLLWTTALTLAGMPLIGGSYFGPEFFTSNGVCLPLHIHDPYTQGWEYSAAMYIVLNSVALALICTAYCKMLQVIRSSALALRSTQERQDRVVAQRFAVIVATDCFCWIPVIIIKVIALTGVAIPEDLYAWLAIFILPINSALNPILYTLTTKLFKQQISRLLYACKHPTDTPGHGSAISLSFGPTPTSQRKLFVRSRTTRSSVLNSTGTGISNMGAYLGTAV